MLLTAWCAALAAFAGLAAAVRAAASVPVPATFRINATGPRTPSFAHVFHHTVGSGHATLGLRDDWRAHLRLARDALGLRQVRFHGIFDDDMGPVVSNSSSGGAMQYNFTRIGKTLDFIVRELGMAPYVELSFMHSALASKPEKTYLQYKAGVSPPKNQTMGHAGRGVRHFSWIIRLKRIAVAFEVERPTFSSPSWADFGGQHVAISSICDTARPQKTSAALQVGGPATRHDRIPHFSGSCAAAVCRGFSAT